MPNVEDSDQSKENAFFLVKDVSKTLIGGKDADGNPQAYFDTSDVGVIQSTALLQKLNNSEFVLGSEGEVNQTWFTFLQQGSKVYSMGGNSTPSTVTITWNNSSNLESDIEKCRDLEVNWAQSVLDQWDTVVTSPGPPPFFKPINTNFGQKVFNSGEVKNDLLSADPSISSITSKDTLKSYLEDIISGANNHSVKPGSRGRSTIPIVEYFKFYNSSTGEKFENPGTVDDLMTLINSIYGNTESEQIQAQRDNLSNFSSLGEAVLAFQNSTEYSVGPFVQGEERITGYQNINTEEAVSEIPEGEDIANFTPLTEIISILDNFKKQFSKYTDLGAPEHLFSGVMINNYLIENQTISGLADTPSGNISGMLLVSDGSGFDYVSHTLTGLSDTPTGYLSGYYLRSHASGFEYISPEDFGESIDYFTGLSDTPSGYVSHSGHYLIVNDGESGIHFTGIEKIAQDLTNHGFVGGEGSNHFTGLQDTPSDYNSGHYLRSTDNGIEYAEPSELGQDILTNTTGLASGYLRIDDDGTGIVIVDRETFKDEIDLQADFTGLQDTPSDYSEGDYLRSTSNGLEYVTTSGLAQDIGDEIVNNIVTGDLLGFTGLNDTPTGYETGKFVRVNSAGDAVEYSDISFLNDVIDAPESQLVSGFLQLDKDGKLVWSPATTDGDVSFTITGATHFTGLLDTPNAYDNGKFLAFDAFKNQITGVELKLASSFYGPADVINDPNDLAKVGDKKILEYHKTQEHGYEIKWVDQITEITTFTGLNDTPTNYQEGKYLRSTADGLEYVDITGLAEEVSAEIDFPEGATAFTGLHDTPADYKNYEDRYFVVSSGDSLSYEQVKFLENVKDAPNVNNVPSDGTGYLQLVQESNEWILKWAPGTIEGDITQNFQGTEYFTGLEDTPTDYQEGKYLRSTANGLEYIDITGLAEEVSSEIDFPEGVTRFTGLHDTPINYNNGAYLRSTTNGLEYAGIEPTKYNSINDLPAQAANHDGEVVRVGCDLYLSCDGVWKKFKQETSEVIDDPNDIFPECVETTAEALQYQQYFDEVMAAGNSSSFIDGLNGTSENSDLKSVCLFKKDLYNSVSWGQSSWQTRGFSSMGNFGIGKEHDSNCSPKFKKGSDQLFFIIDTRISSSTVDTMDLIVGKINDSFQYEKVWSKRVNNEGYNGVADITDDFKHIVYSQNRVSSTTVYDIHVLDNNETTGGYEQNRPPITIELAQSLYNITPLNSNSNLGILPFRISQDGKRVFVMLGHGTATNTSLRLFIFEWNGTDWVLPYVMDMPTPKDGAVTMITSWIHSFLLNEDESVIYLIGGRIQTSSKSGGVFRINYENVSIGPQIGQNFWNHSSNGVMSMNNLGNIITSRDENSSDPNYIWKYNENSGIWDRIASIKSTYLSMSRNGKFFFDKTGFTGKVYYYNESTNSLIQIAQNLSTSNTGNNAAISDSGQSIAYPNNTATIALSQIPEVEGDIYNNSVVIEESNYKWGLFEGNTNINLSGSIDTNCTFTEWQTSDVNLTDSSNINTTANINKSASITGVFNCG